MLQLSFCNKDIFAGEILVERKEAKVGGAQNTMRRSRISGLKGEIKKIEMEY